MHNEETTEIQPVEVAEETMLGDLMESVLQELRLAQKPWEQLSEDEQSDVISRTKRRVQNTIRQAVNIIASHDQVTVRAEVESVTFKDGAKAVLKAPGYSEGIHEVANNIGGSVLIVLLNSEELTEQEHHHKAEPDQKALGIDDQELEEAA